LLPGRSAHLPRIGYVPITAPARDTSDPEFQALLAGLRDYGYIDGQNIQVEYRFPTDASQYPEIVSDLVRLGVDVLLTQGTGTTQAAQAATSTVPIVGIAAAEPVATGLVQSLSRPGGNVTVISQSSSNGTVKLRGGGVRMAWCRRPVLQPMSRLRTAAIATPPRSSATPSGFIFGSI
jgi:hypothetical protein